MLRKLREEKQKIQIILLAFKGKQSFWKCLFQNALASFTLKQFALPSLVCVRERQRDRETEREHKSLMLSVLRF